MTTVTLTMLATGDLIISHGTDALGTVEYVLTGEVSYTISSRDCFDIKGPVRDFDVTEGETRETRLIAREWCARARTYGHTSIAN